MKIQYLVLGCLATAYAGGIASTAQAEFTSNALNGNAITFNALGVNVQTSQRTMPSTTGVTLKNSNFTGIQVENGHLVGIK